MMVYNRHNPANCDDVKLLYMRGFSPQRIVQMHMTEDEEPPFTVAQVYHAVRDGKWRQEKDQRSLRLADEAVRIASDKIEACRASAIKCGIDVLANPENHDSRLVTAVFTKFMEVKDDKKLNDIVKLLGFEQLNFGGGGDDSSPTI
jgi:hypothetical protein